MNIPVCPAATIICEALAFAIPASGASDDYSALMKLIMDSEDSHMNAMDLAFLLATHNFDSTPEAGYVIVKGLSDVTTISNAPNG